MQSDDKFQETLAMGTAGEDIVLDYLEKHNSYVQDTRYQVHGKGHGPRLKGTEGRVVLPDFVVYNKNPSKGNFAVDVKVKSSIYPANGKKCFTVDKKFLDYKKSVEIMKLDFLVIIFMHNDRMYFYKDTDMCGTTVYNNQYGSGAVYCFEYDESKIRY